MSRCHKCRSKNIENYKFCSNCGEKNSYVPVTYSYSIAILGAGGSGKSAVVIQFVNRQFESKYDPTIEDRYQKIIEYEGIPCVLEILDTAGQETFSSMRELYFKNSQGFVLLYSITHKKSLDDLLPIYEGIVRCRGSEYVPMILVGNKCDLEKKRAVSIDEGKNVARQFKCPFIESSAKQNINIDNVFHSLIEQSWQKKGRPQSRNTSQTKSSGCIIL